MPSRLVEHTEDEIDLICLALDNYREHLSGDIPVSVAREPDVAKALRRRIDSLESISLRLGAPF